MEFSIFSIKLSESYNKVFLLTKEQTPRPRTGINNVDYKRKQKNPIMTLDYVVNDQVNWLI